MNESMKPINDYITTVDFNSYKEAIANIPVVESESVTSTTAGVDTGDAAPLAFKAKKSKVFGHTCLEVDPDTYHSCRCGKMPYERWSKYVEDEELRNEIKSAYNRNGKLLIKNSLDGAMVFIK